MRVLVAGGAGYVGSVLIPRLLDKGFDVICLDRVFFGIEPMKDFIDDIEFFNIDIREKLPKTIFDGVDTLVNLAAISQPDELQRINPELYYEINYLAAVNLAKRAKQFGVNRHIFTSTCSVYGAQNVLLSEVSEPKPLEAYGKSKLMAEIEILELNSKDFTVTVIRPGTMYGYSPKMRFDLVVNAMTWSLFKFGKINVMRPGTQVRPNVHVDDVCSAIIKIIESETSIIEREIFNIGSTDQNYEIQQLAELIGRSVTNDYSIEWFGEGDRRTYCVIFQKLRDILGFKPKHTVQNAAKNIYEKLINGEIEKRINTLVINWYEKLEEENLIFPYNLRKSK